MTDNWKHRSAGMKCLTCMWFAFKSKSIAEKKKTTESEVPTILKILGRCRRRAPTMNGYPVVFGDDWCGDHKVDEDKI